MTASTGELHTASGEWLSNVFLALAKFAVRRPKTRWVLIKADFHCCVFRSHVQARKTLNPSIF
jgi:hypothetical protein